VAISKVVETGLNHVQVLPDNPCVGQVEPFRGLGYGQLLSTGMFEFTRHRIPRSQAKTELRLPHSTLSRCKDCTLRFTFIVREEQIAEDPDCFTRWLETEAQQACHFLKGGEA
jgi:hypothetical protein